MALNGVRIKSDGSAVYGIEIRTQGHTRNFEAFKAVKEINEF